MGERLKLNSVSGNVVSFDTDLEKKLGSLKIGIEPVQEGSGDPSPDNVRPISGYTSINIIQQKKNFFDADTQYAIYKQSDGSYLGQGTKFDAIRMYIPSFLINQQVTFSALIRKTENSTITNPRACAVVNGSTLNGDFINTSDYSLSFVTFIPKSINDYIRITYGSSGSGTIQLKNIQLELGSTVTDYEPYVNTTYPITLPSAAGTVYGGELDLAKGILSVNWIKINASDITWTHSSSYPDGVFQGRLPYARATKEINVISDVYKGVSHGYVVANMPNQTIKGNQNAVYNYNIYVRDDRYITLEEFNKNLNANIVYELETPQTYSLAPTEISTLLGANTLYADCGPIQEASYFSRDYVPVISDTGLITITDGVEAPIDSLKVHFEPIQEGSGDPSPENVRPISGWSGVEATRTGKNLFGGTTLANKLKTLDSRVKINTTEKTVMFFAGWLSNKTIIDGIFKPNTPYTIYVKIADGTTRINFGIRYTDGTTETSSFVDGPNIFNANGNKTIKNLYCRYISGDTVLYYDQFGIFEGIITADDFESYTGQTYPVTFPSEAGTVYGGYVDVAKGELVANKVGINLGALNYSKDAAGYFQTAPSELTLNDARHYASSTKPNILCAQYKTMTVVQVTDNDNAIGMYWYSSGNRNILRIRDNRFLDSTASEFKQAMDGIMLVYPLAEPITYSLTPTQLSTIKGVNNIYSDVNGAIEMSYYSPVKENMIATRRSVVASAPHTETVSGGIASFETNMTAKLKNLTIDIEPIQEGSGDPSPDNARPISGWTEANIIKCGKNLFDETNATIFVRYFQATNNSDLWTSYSDSGSYAFKCKPNQTYTVSCNNPDITIFRVGYINVNPDELTQSESPVIYSPVRKGASGSVTITTGADAKAIIVQINQFIITTKNTQTQIELGSTPTDYEPYAGTTISITFPTEAGTVYGGTLNVTTGELTVDSVMLTVNGDSDLVGITNYETHARITNRGYQSIGGTRNVTFKACDKFKCNRPYEQELYAVWNATAGTRMHFGIPPEITTNDEAKAWFAENPTQIVAQLETPQTYQLTPTEIQTLLGANNIYADTGNTNLTYWKH